MSRCVSVLAFVVFSIALATSTHAQIQPRWNGPYIGASIGRGSAELDGSATISGGGGTTLNHSVDASGPFGGIQAGFNRRIGNFFVGLEADLQTADFSGSTKVSSGPLTYTASASLDWFATARARAGFATNTMLVYVTGGIAFGGMDYDATVKSGNASVHLRDDIRAGFVLGAGAEFALRSNWSLKLEYQYLNFGDHGATGAVSSIFNNYCAPPTVTTNAISTNFDTDIHTVRVGLNYHFHAPPTHDPLKP
jgi:outer membrane immunogenic protein